MVKLEMGGSPREERWAPVQRQLWGAGGSLLSCGLLSCGGYLAAGAGVGCPQPQTELSELPVSVPSAQRPIGEALLLPALQVGRAVPSGWLTC